MDRHLARGLFLAIVALGFGLSSLQYQLGSFSRAGAGLFPLLVSSLLMLIALATIVQSRFVRSERLQLNPRNIGLLLGALCAFALVSKFVNMTLGIVVMVFIAGIAGSAAYSWKRNLKVALALLAVAFAFHKLLGLNLPLY
ncbi:tripartite tricarboxylate transporter TctB family protein [Piscinibacter sakaiensis]|uniref:Tricarboxylate transport protein TctB n=1 Tax=Piscinibacter sakaiensis TaxID=1547922 RepID=A0A0K8NVE6_PISS1|nr:tripartite tricarboxylate transporter TctB family protein [Piscinibacter sakaiensis]GAP34353.1 tricarboxylate transport protein TctB [Piscinibacter sakaiensis]